jgi:hypothetical protein
MLEEGEEARSQRTQGAFQAAYEEFLRAVHQACGPDDRRRQVEAAYTAYLSAMQEASRWPDPTEGVRSAQERLVAALRGSFAPDTPQQIQEAYVSFVETLRRCWSKVEVIDLTPETMLVLGESMRSAAWTAEMAAAAGADAAAPNRSPFPSTGPVV